MPPKDIEADLIMLEDLRALDMGLVVMEMRFHPTREWRFDYCIPQVKLACEIEGGIWSLGRHTRGKGYQADLDKYNAAVTLGWNVLRFSTKDVRNGSARSTLREFAAIKKREQGRE